MRLQLKTLTQRFQKRQRRLAATPEQEAELAERRRLRQQVAARSAQIARQR